MSMKFPHPLDRSKYSLLNPGTWALPATTLTTGSIFVFFSVFWFISSNELLRNRFFFPGESLFVNQVLGAVAVGLGWAILSRTHSRPSSLYVKIWTLVLVGISVLCFFLQLSGEFFWWPWDQNWPWPQFKNTLLLAVLSAIVALFPRFLQPRVDSRLIQWVATMTLCLLLPLIAVVVFGLGAFTEDFTRDRVIEYAEMAENKLKAIEGRLATVTSDPTIAEDEKDVKLHMLAREVATVQEDMEDVSADAALTGQLDLIEGPKAMLSQIEEKLILMTEATTLRQMTISEHAKPVIYYDFESKSGWRWVKDGQTGNEYAKIARYFESINRVAEKLGQGEDGDAVSRKINEVRERIDSVIDNWADRWLTGIMPAIYTGSEYEQSAYMDYLISTPFVRLIDHLGETKRVSLAQMQEILTTDIDTDRAGEIARQSGCYDSDFASRHEKGKLFTAIVCQAYNGDSEAGVLPVLELRLVYERDTGRQSEVAVIIPDTENQYSLDVHRFLERLELALRAGDTRFSGTIGRPMVKTYYGGAKFIYVRFTQ